jgi:DNA excision repair protein ERCC-2
MENAIVIVDEAHNLAARVRDYLSSSVNTFTMRRVAKELRAVGLKPPQLDQFFDDWVKNALGKKEEASVAKEDFYSYLSLFDSDFYSSLEDAGIAYATSTGKRSACLRFIEFMESWDNEMECIRLAKRSEFGFHLSKRMLDPSELTAALNAIHSSILMSGTLIPLEMHRDVLGLDKNKTVMKTYPSPFSKSSILNIICAGMTTRYPERTHENYESMAEKINKIAECTPGGVAVFFPSYSVLDAIVPLLKASELFIQESDMKPRETKQLLDDFRKKGGMLCGVQGGSLSEGIDYSKGEIKTIVIVGIALEEMSLEVEALIDYYNKKFGKGWEYGYLYPGTIKALQAAGRGRRKDDDRVAVVYMDERFKWKKYCWIFDRNEKLILTSEPERYVKEFWVIGNE